MRSGTHLPCSLLKQAPCLTRPTHSRFRICWMVNDHGSGQRSCIAWWGGIQGLVPRTNWDGSTLYVSQWLRNPAVTCSRKQKNKNPVTTCGPEPFYSIKPIIAPSFFFWYWGGNPALGKCSTTELNLQRSFSMCHHCLVGLHRTSPMYLSCPGSMF
jgi:hypothetical protein